MVSAVSFSRPKQAEVEELFLLFTKSASWNEPTARTEQKKASSGFVSTAFLATALLSHTHFRHCQVSFTNRFYSSGRFRGGGKNGGAKSPGIQTGAQPTSPTGNSQGSASSTNLAPRVPPLPNSPSLSQSLSMENPGAANLANSNDPLAVYNLPRPKPLWLNDTYSKHIVKGNFMTLSARPKTVEQGEWIAHQGISNSLAACIHRLTFASSC